MTPITSSRIPSLNVGVHNLDLSPYVDTRRRWAGLANPIHIPRPRITLRARSGKMVVVRLAVVRVRFSPDHDGLEGDQAVVAGLGNGRAAGRVGAGGRRDDVVLAAEALEAVRRAVPGGQLPAQVGGIPVAVGGALDGVLQVPVYLRANDGHAGADHRASLLGGGEDEEVGDAICEGRGGGGRRRFQPVSQPWSGGRGRQTGYD
ncbi:hypothetical protein VTG60DRAFT_5039 [Thermothelomyces hinnuleus]